MKNLYSKNEFLTIHKDGEILNENFIGKMFKGLLNSVIKLANKVKGSKEINAVYDKYKKNIDTTFAKVANVGAAETVSNVAPSTPITTPASGTTQNSSFNFVGNKLNEATATANPATTPPVETADQKKQNTTEQKNLVNLTPEKIAKVAKLTEDQIEKLRTQFNGEIDAIVKRLSKNPDYSSDKLTAYSTVMKNQFNTYVFDQWWGIYQKAGDQKKLTELTKTKKENELKFKQAVDALNTKLGEKSTQVTVTSGTKYKYDSTTQGKEIEVTVLGKAIGQDENGAPDTTKPEHKGMWKVKSDKGEFWVAPSALKAEVKTPVAGTTVSAIKKEDIKANNSYSFKNKEGKAVIATVKANKDGKVVSDDGKLVFVTTVAKPGVHPIGINILNPIK
jgi:hypothetical protein